MFASKIRHIHSYHSVSFNESSDFLAVFSMWEWKKCRLTFKSGLTVLVSFKNSIQHTGTFRSKKGPGQGLMQLTFLYRNRMYRYL